MEDLRNHLGKKSAEWIKDNILYQPMFRGDFADDKTVAFYQGKQISDEDMEIIKRLLRGK